MTSLDAASLHVSGDGFAGHTVFSQLLRLFLGRVGWEGATEPSSPSFCCWWCWYLWVFLLRFFPFSSQTCFSPSPVPESRAVLVTVLSSESSHCRMLLHQKTLWSVPLSADSLSSCVADVSALQRPRRQHPTGLARRRFRFP